MYAAPKYRIRQIISNTPLFVDAVKWTIADDEEERSPDAGADAAAVNANSVSVWWPATLRARLNEFHTLTDEERNESAYCTIPSTSVNVPIYQLCYSPLEGKKETNLSSFLSALLIATK